MASESDYLTPEQIEAITARDKAYGEGEHEPPQDIAIDRAKLLRHLDALAAPADGEALGRVLHKALEIDTRCTPFDWPDLSDENAERYRAAALRLHAIGHAAGALSREGEIAALREDLEGERHAYAIRAETERTEIARLTRENAAQVEAWRVNEQQRTLQHHTIERLAAELADAQATLRDVNPQIQSVIDDRDEEIARLEKELAGARADGAREEQEACATVAQSCIDGRTAAARIRARGDR